MTLTCVQHLHHLLCSATPSAFGLHKTYWLVVELAAVWAALYSVLTFFVVLFKR